MIKLIAILAIASFSLVAAQDPAEPKCGVCMEGNEVLCSSETSYYFCFSK